ncbi:hypothetical protein RHCRD62_30344 [Rhodococcus sp. RD6.2]|jgi:hypothetical protein|nr:hypothetical protein RHCRD62_30344 [Rhodococcus sp. RD6.2]
MSQIIDYMYDDGMTACYDPITNPGFTSALPKQVTQRRFVTQKKHPRYCM